MKPYPEWLHILAWASLGVAFFCALVIVADVIRRPQKMGIMNLVWPITALYWGPLGLWAYFRVGSKTTQQRHQQMMDRALPGK